ncbi:hypothetical protein Trydic_g15171 [Trypoxylus dichotomus]
MNDKHQYEITDERAVILVSSDGNEIDDQASTIEAVRISHNNGVKALKITIKYVEQQEEAAGIDIMML